MEVKKSKSDDIKVAVILRAARSGLGISQAELATELDVSQSAITRCERGEGSIPANVLLRAIGFFRDQGIDVSGIFMENPAVMFRDELFEALEQTGKGRRKRRARASNGDQEGDSDEG